MAVFKIPLPTGVPQFVEQTQLDGLTFTIRIHWNERESAWYLEIGDVDGVVIVASRKLVANWPLLQRVTDERKPPGEIYCIDLTDEGVDPGLDDLGERVDLVYIDAAEMAATA